MPRTPVTTVQLAGLIAAALNNTTVNTGTITAVVDGHNVHVRQHTDSASPAYDRAFDVQIR